MKEELVSISKASGIEDKFELKEKLTELLEPFGGPESFLKSGEDILLKPNLVSDYGFRSGATTNPNLVEALMEIFLPLRPSRIIIADGAAVGQDTREVMEKLGYTALLSDYPEREIELLDFKEGPFVEKEVPEGRELKTLEIPEILDEVDRILNLPVAKTHNSLPVTLGLKNMKGIIREGMKKVFHRRDLRQCILDLNKVVSPDLTVYDGTVGMEGRGPVSGDPVDWKVLMAAEDQVAGDLTVARAMGFKRKELELLKMAETQGLGAAEEGRIKLRGESIQEVERTFEKHSLDEDFYEELGVSVHDRGGCSGCRHVLDCMGKELREEAGSRLEGMNLYIGPGEVEDEREENLLIGNCLRDQKEKGQFIPGCPPHEAEILEKF